MTLKQHLETADDLAIALHHLARVFYRVQKHENLSSKLMVLLRKSCPVAQENRWINIRGILDDQYHALINDKQFDELGHIYYNLEERYKKLNGKGGNLTDEANP